MGSEGRSDKERIFVAEGLERGRKGLREGSQKKNGARLPRVPATTGLEGSEGLEGWWVHPVEVIRQRSVVIGHATEAAQHIGQPVALEERAPLAVPRVRVGVQFGISRSARDHVSCVPQNLRFHGRARSGSCAVRARRRTVADCVGSTCRRTAGSKRNRSERTATAVQDSKSPSA